MPYTFAIHNDCPNLRFLLTEIVNFSAQFKSFTMVSVLVGVSIAIKRHHDHGNTYKEKTFSWGWLTYSFRGSVHYHHVRKHGDLLEKELKVLHLAGHRESTVTPGGIRRIGNLKAHPHSVTLPTTGPFPLQQSHTF